MKRVYSIQLVKTTCSDLEQITNGLFVFEGDSIENNETNMLINMYVCIIIIIMCII